MTVGTPEPFRVTVSAEAERELRERLRRARLPAQIPGQGWSRGTDTTYLADFLRYWAEHYDFRRFEQRLNTWPQFRVTVGGVPLHCEHARARSRRRQMPLLMMHGWPSSTVQFHRVIARLADPSVDGAGPEALGFHVVNVSLPGYGFSGNPLQTGFAVRAMAERIHLLMTTVLGYPRYAVRGSDIGGVVQQQLALLYPDAIIGNHTSGTLRGAPLPPRSELSEVEQRYLADNDAWSANELAYANLHASKPQTLGNALEDSPVALASWILEKFHAWGDTSRGVDERFGREALIDNLMVYWLGGNATASVQFDYEFRRETRRALGRVPQPTAVLMGMKDMVPPPRELVQRQFNLTRWNELPRGGHFLEWEEPEITARDLREFFAPLAVD